MLYLPGSVHKILIHTPEVIIDIGELSEEAAEGKKKI